MIHLSLITTAIPRGCQQTCATWRVSNRLHQKSIFLNQQQLQTNTNKLNFIIPLFYTYCINEVDRLSYGRISCLSNCFLCAGIKSYDWSELFPLWRSPPVTSAPRHLITYCLWLIEQVGQIAPGLTSSWRVELFVINYALNYVCESVICDVLDLTQLPRVGSKFGSNCCLYLRLA